jgi:formamidopyrimidine-DNA glycosylase
MPELPEVQTTASGLNRVLSGLIITDVWTDYDSPHFYGSDNIKDPAFFKKFKKGIVSKKILHVARRAKNILIHLSGGWVILIHMKMTGHVLYGDYDRNDPFNRHIHLIFKLSNGKTFELCDARKFAKVTLIKAEALQTSIHVRDLGPEPLEKNFSFKTFKERLFLKPCWKIKPALLDQTLIAGIGNIYSDESLWRADIHPEHVIHKITDIKLKKLYGALLTTLSRGVDFGGDSMSDYRNIDGKPGRFQEQHRAYRKTGTKCTKRSCTGTIKRIVVANRGTHFCDTHQKL